jgi:hypothetical protein
MMISYSLSSKNKMEIISLLNKHVLLCLFILFTNFPVFSQEFSGYIASESRIFPESPLDSKQHGSSLSFTIKPEFYFDWNNGYQSFLFVPFLMLDQFDEERTHWDSRKLYWSYVADQFELRVGIRQVFWGVTESQHLVDIINQTDFVENIDGEQKLGQPMFNFVWIQDWGTIDLFILTGFRERYFPGRKGRLRFPIRVDTNYPLYESKTEKKHIDLAVRRTHTLGSFDIGISRFYGTNREPRFLTGFSSESNPKLIPFYDIIHQTGLDV